METSPASARDQHTPRMRPAAESRSTFYVRKIERGTQAVRQFGGIVVGPEMHEVQVWGVVDHVAVQRRHLNPVLPQRFQHWIDLTAEQDEIPGNRGLAAASGLEVNGDRRAHGSWY